LEKLSNSIRDLKISKSNVDDLQIEFKETKNKIFELNRKTKITKEDYIKRNFDVFKSEHIYNKLQGIASNMSNVVDPILKNYDKQITDLNELIKLKKEAETVFESLSEVEKIQVRDIFSKLE